MDSWLKRAGLAAIAAATTAGSAGAATLMVGRDGSCGKATCFSDAGVYTRTWSAGNFTGPVDVAALLMDRGVLGALAGMTFRISFSQNGQDLGTWGRFNMGGFGDETLGFSGEGFVWNPADGDLVLTLALDPPPEAGAGAAFSSSSADDPPIGPPPAVLRNAAFAAAVPEPAAWSLMIVGFGLAGVATRARRRLPAAGR